MGKNKRRQIQHHDSFHDVDVLCDSIEECDFIDWCSEAASKGLIIDFTYQPEPIKLFDAVKYKTFDKKDRTLFREHIYSPDFIVEFDPRSSQTLCKAFKLSYEDSQKESFQAYLDVKGTFQRNDGGRSFSLNQKWVYQKTGIYVQKIVPKEFFKLYGCPLNCFITRKTKKKRKIYSGYPGIDQMIKKAAN